MEVLQVQMFGGFAMRYEGKPVFRRSTRFFPSISFLNSFTDHLCPLKNPYFICKIKCLFQAFFFLKFFSVYDIIMVLHGTLAGGAYAVLFKTR